MANALDRTAAVIAAKYTASAINLVSQNAPVFIQRKVYVLTTAAVSANLFAASSVDVPKLLAC
jgi:hypothetical protein